MKSMKEIAEENSPLPTKEWLSKTEKNRLTEIDLICNNYLDKLSVVGAHNNGHVIVSLKINLPPRERGDLLLDFEFYLKQNIDDSITIWLEPLGDKSSLRRLRGIEVKK